MQQVQREPLVVVAGNVQSEIAAAIDLRRRQRGLAKRDRAATQTVATMNSRGKGKGTPPSARAG